MSDGEQLLFFLSLIYLSGCLTWVDRRTILFSSWFGGRWKSVVADYRWGNLSGRIFLLNPLPPLGFIFKSHLMPISFSPTNIVVYNAQTVGNCGQPPQSGRMAPIAPDTKFSRKGSELLVNGKSFCDFYDIEMAHKLVILLNAIKSYNEGAREQAIHKFWEDRLSVHRAKEQIRNVLAASLQVREICLLDFLLFFAVIPLTSFRFGVNLAVVVGAFAMFISALIICLSYISCHRQHYPILKVGLWSNLANMMLCPLVALRASDLVMCKLSGQLDALPLAALLLHGADRKSFLASYLYDLEAAELPNDLPDVIRMTCLWQNQTIVKVGLSVIPGLKLVRGVQNANSEQAEAY